MNSFDVQIDKFERQIDSTICKNIVSKKAINKTKKCKGISLKNTKNANRKICVTNKEEKKIHSCHELNRSGCNKCFENDKQKPTDFERNIQVNLKREIGKKF